MQRKMRMKKWIQKGFYVGLRLLVQMDLVSLGKKP